MKSGLGLMNRRRFALPNRFRPHHFAFDIDGVVADTMAVFVELVRKELGIRHFSKDDIVEYELYKCVPAPRETIDEVLCKTLSDEYTEMIPPMPGAKEFLTRLGKLADLRFVTARVWPDSIIKWLHKLLPDIDKRRIQVVATGDPGAKKRILKDMGVKVFVEDRLDTCCALRKEGFHVILFDQPWNREADGFFRIRHWKELEKFIEWDEGAERL